MKRWAERGQGLFGGGKRQGDSGELSVEVEIRAVFRDCNTPSWKAREAIQLPGEAEGQSSRSSVHGNDGV